MLKIKFDGRILYWRGPSPYHFVRVPAKQCLALKAVSGLVSYGWGMIPVTAPIGKTEWTTSLFPKDGRYLLPVKDSVRNAMRLEADERVTVRLAVC